MATHTVFLPENSWTEEPGRETKSWTPLTFKKEKKILYHTLWSWTFSKILYLIYALQALVFHPGA